MVGLNRMILTGRLTKDPELRYTKNEIAVASFTVAVNNLKNKENKEDVNFFDCIAWRGLASVCSKYLKKGSLVAIEGKLSIRPYESKGIKRKATEIIIDNLVMLDNKFFKAATPAISETSNDDCGDLV